VVITGGDPTLQNGLPEFLRLIRDLGYLIKLDTNGSRPNILEELLNHYLIDYIAMDIKTSLQHYSETAGTLVDINAILQSIKLIIESGMEHEFRTTMVKPFVMPEDITEVVPVLAGARKYTLQKLKASPNILEPGVSTKSQYRDKELASLQEKANRLAAPIFELVG
jgi:pyruvate formate lyase activating enzyme